MRNFKYYFLGLLILVTGFVWYAVFAESRDGLLVVFLDVGQGDAIFIEAPNGNQVLIDGGPNKAVLRQLSKIMPFYDRSIDMIIESHPDSDHINGLVEVLRRYKVGLVMESGVVNDNQAYKSIQEIIEEKGIQKVLARRGTRINFGDGIYMDIMFPDRDVSGLETNMASVVARLVYRESEFLFTGDSPRSIEQYLVSIGKENLQSDILKISHHGSDTSTSEMFLGYVDPEYAVISVGKDNKYGHPRQEVLDLLNQFDVKILRTDQSGTIKIKSDGENIILE
ncbi:MBL fold metallo-hydrolase [Patescibacteria group bacterium]|nr:MBL fold metallo-hydrolase [Patescibacteria group bacterium]